MITESLISCLSRFSEEEKDTCCCGLGGVVKAAVLWVAKRRLRPSRAPRVNSSGQRIGHCSSLVRMAQTQLWCSATGLGTCRLSLPLERPTYCCQLDPSHNSASNSPSHSFSLLLALLLCLFVSLGCVCEFHSHSSWRDDLIGLVRYYLI